MRKLLYAPNSDGYTWADGAEAVLVELDGGSPRVRSDVLNSAARLQAQWFLDRDGYEYFRSFYKVVIAENGGKFLCDLIMDQPGLTEHVCVFIPGSMTLMGQKGLSYTVSASMSVTPIPIDLQLEQNKLDLIEAYGGIENLHRALNMFDKLANIYLPRID